jgi:type VI secretion system protein ImpK
MSDQDPFSSPDATSIRPKPGGGRLRWGDGARQRPAPPTPDADPLPEAAHEFLGLGLNPLVRAASPLLLLGGQLRGSTSPMDVEGLRTHALHEIRRFEDQARAAGVASEIVVAARYVLCAHLDEAVLSTPWGSQSEWAQHPLLVTLHREAWGGEKFFEMLDRVSTDPSKYINLLELQYLCLALGFGGKYQVQQRGSERLAGIQQELYRTIKSHRDTAPQALSLRWRGLQDRRNPLVRYVPLWVVGAVTLVLIAVFYIFYYSQLATLSSPVHAELAKIGIEDFARPVAPVPGPRLKVLLAPEESAGLLTAVEEGGRTIVTLVGDDLFASGSTTVNPTHYPTLQKIARAINQVGGRVLIEGHTDDQRVRSLRYRDNFQLSSERALSVAKILQQTLENDARVQATGAGASKPRYTPESEPANRARNRRVEIIHVGGS